MKIGSHLYNETHSPEYRQLRVLEDQREAGISALLPTELSEVLDKLPHRVGWRSLDLLWNATAAMWDRQHPAEAETISEIRSQMLLRLGTPRSRAKEAASRQDDLDVFLFSVEKSSVLPLVSIDSASTHDALLAPYADLVFEGKDLPDRFMNDLHAEGPLGESSKPDRFAELLALRFVQAFCTLPYNPDASFQSTLLTPSPYGASLVEPLELAASDIMGRYVAFLGQLPKVTALASLTYFERISSSTLVRAASGPYLGGYTDPEIFGPGYNLPRDLVASQITALLRPVELDIEWFDALGVEDSDILRYWYWYEIIPRTLAPLNLCDAC